MKIHFERTGTFNVTLASYTGMSIPLVEDVERGEAITAAKRHLRRARRRGCPVEKIGRGQWEIGTPDDACMVGDSEGILTIRPHTRRYRRILGRKVYTD